MRNFYNNLTGIEARCSYFEYKNPFKQSLRNTIINYYGELSWKILIPQLIKKGISHYFVNRMEI